MTRGLLYINKTGVTIFVPLTNLSIRVEFPPSAVKDMDVISDEQVATLIASTFQANKITPPGSFLILLDDSTLFVRDFPSAQQQPAPTPQQPAPQQVSKQVTKTSDMLNQKNFLKDQDVLIQSFVDKVPFEVTSSKIVTTATSRKVIVTNKALFMAIKNACIKAGFTIEAVVPGQVFQKVVNLTNGVTLATVNAVLSQNEIIKQNDLSVDNTIVKHTVVDAKTGKEMPSKTRALILIGIFAFLFLVMIAMYYFMYMQPEPVKKEVRKPKPVSKQSAKTVSPTITQAITPSASASAGIALLQVRMQSNTTSATQAATLRTGFTTLGVTNITVVNTQTLPPRPLIVFTPDITESDREIILRLVETTYPTIVSQETDSGENAITLTLSR